MQRSMGFAILTALAISGAPASGQSVLFDFESGGDQGWGAGFGDDASEAIPVVNIAGSNRLAVLRDGAFQEAGRSSGNVAEPFFIALNAASANEAGYILSYDWYVDTAPTNDGTFLQLGTYANTGSGYYAQDFPGTGKDVDLTDVQLTSGQVFSGTVSETFAAKGFDLPTAQTFLRIGLIVNGDGAASVYFDNVRISPVPEPASIGMICVAGMALLRFRRRS